MSDPSGQSQGNPAAPGGPLSVGLKGAFLANRASVVAYASRHIPADLRASLDSEDVWQEVCLECFRRYAGHASLGPDDVSRLFLTVARHILVDAVRAARAAKRGGNLGRIEDLREAAGGDVLVPLLEQLAVYQRTPSHSAIAHEAAAQLQSSLARLPDDYARCIRLRHVEQRSVAETADLMSTSEGAVKQMCRRAMELLRCDLLLSIAVT